MKILLTGSKGQLGQAIIKSFKKLKNVNSIKLLETSREQFNLLEFEECVNFIEKNKPDLIINSAAYTNVDKAEEEYDIAKRINADAPRIISETLLKNGGKLLHISTDYVFKGNKFTPYLPNDLKEPLNNYGKSKADGEKAIQEILFPTNQGFILRTSWLIGPVGKNFVNTMLNLLENRSELKVIFDQIGSPTSTISLAKVCWQIVDKLETNQNLPKIMHWSDSGIASWYDIAMAISDISLNLELLPKTALIEPIFTKDFKTLASRPLYSLLNCKETEKALDIKQIYWRKALEEILEIKKNSLDG